MSILNLWKKQASSFYSTSLSLSWAYSWGRSPLWKGKKVLMGKWGGGGGQSESVARLDSHVLLSCINPPNSVIFASQFRTDHGSNEPKTMKQKKIHTQYSRFE